MGDVILTTGAFPVLREHFPGARIDYLTRAPYVPLLSEEPLIDRVLPLPSSSGGGKVRNFLTYLEFLASLRKSRYDLVLDFFARGPRSRIIVRVTGAPKRLGIVDHESSLGGWLNARIYTQRVIPPVQIPHMRDRIPYLLSRLVKLARNSPNPRLTVTPKNLEEARLILERDTSGRKKFWVLFCGSGIPSKNWPADRFALIARELVSEGFDVLCLGGKEDRSVQESFREALGTETEGIHLYTDLPFGTLKGLCHLATGALGNDSGPLHLAQAVGTPSVVLFGPGDHVSYAPFLGKAVRGNLACQPCQSFASHCPDNQCMKMIPVSSVREAVQSLPARTMA